MRSKLLTTGGFALALVILLLLASLTYQDMEHAAIAARDVDRAYLVLHNLDQLFSDLKDAETGQRGYVITGNAAFLNPYYRSIGEIEQRSRKLRELAGNNPQQEARIGEIDRLIVLKLAQLKETVDTRRLQGYAAAQRLVASGAGEELMDRIRTEADAARAAESVLLKAKSDTRKTAVRRLRVAITGGGTASFVLLLTAFFFLRNEIAARIKVEEELREHQEGLEHLVAERTRDLAVTNEQLIEENVRRGRAEADLKKSLEEVARSNRELDLFASTASHDLRAPLRTITGFLDLLARKYQAKLDDKAREYISFAVNGAERMNVLLNDLYVYSRAGVEAKPFTTVDMEEVLQAAVRNLRQLIDENRALITSEVLPRAEGDETQLVQLLQNLIGNAIKFRKPEAPPKIRISVEEEKETQAWLIGVHDNGIGIGSAYYERIFRIFERLHRSDQYPGTGLGLALCKKIVDRHNGRLWVESKPGEGASFYFTLHKASTTGAPGSVSRDASMAASGAGGERGR